jgi:SAM-dependent methyltransferase
MTEIYDSIGRGYATRRQADPRIALHIRTALASCTSVLNVGAGTGSYEPTELNVVAVEPSFTMIRQRRAAAAPAVQARAEALPFRDASFDAVLGVLTLHHWHDLKLGLAECGRSARKRVVLLTIDLEVYGQFWLLQEYFPDLLAIDQEIFPSIDTIASTLGSVNITAVPIPADCIDGFLGAYWRRPEAYLETAIRAGMSTFAKITNVDDRVALLREDLASGRWHRTHRDLLNSSDFDLGYRLVVAQLH